MSVVVDCTMDTAMKNIVILATGGTIAGAGEQGKDIGYKSGALEAQTLIDAVPELKNVANIFVEQVCNINSDDITSEIWISLAWRIKELASDGFGTSHENVDGFVIMHGTDTMEETAFFLSLTLGGLAPNAAENVAENAARSVILSEVEGTRKNVIGNVVCDASGNATGNVAKPVILTGSMRPATAAEPDGPANLLFAVKSAVEMSDCGAAGRVILSQGEGSRASHSGLSSRPQCRDHRLSFANNVPVFVAFAGKLMDACTVQKVHANALDAFAEISNSGVILSRDEESGASHSVLSSRLQSQPALSSRLQSQPALSSRLQSQSALSSRTPFRDQLLEPTFDISSLRSLPKVSILYFNADADAELVRFAAERSAGLVIAGAGAGEFSQSWAAALANVVAKNIPVVIATRINRGSIVPEQLLVSGTIASYGLPPAKAAVLLRLALTVTNNPVVIQDIYHMYR